MPQFISDQWEVTVSPLKALVLLIFTGFYATEASAGETAQLSFLQSRNSKTEWMVWSAATNRTDVFMELADAPSLVFWESKPGAVLFVGGKSIFQAEIAQTPAKRKQVAALPGGHGDVQVIWRDAASSRLRAAAMLEIAEKDVLNEKGEIKYRLPDGRKIAGITDVDFGLPYACSVLELQADGKTWKLLATRATKGDAGDTPGMSVVDDLRNEAGYSADRLAKSYTCLNGACGNDVPKNLVALASRLAKRKPSDGNGISVWRPGPGLRSVLFGTIFGDTAHAAPPVIILSPDEKSGQNLPLRDLDQLSMGVAAGLLLVTDETNGGHPVVVDLKIGQVRFSAPEATSAVWVPTSSAP
jgi:hypothetical protein